MIGTAGARDHDYAPGDSGNPSSDEWRGVFGGGAGFGFSLRVVRLFVDGRYLLRGDTRFSPLTAGLGISGP